MALLSLCFCLLLFLLERPLKPSGRRWEIALLLEATELAQYAKYLRIERVRLKKNFYLQFEAWTSWILRNFCRLGAESQTRDSMSYAKQTQLWKKIPELTVIKVFPPSLQCPAGHNQGLIFNTRNGKRT